MVGVRRTERSIAMKRDVVSGFVMYKRPDSARMTQFSCPTRRPSKLGTWELIEHDYDAVEGPTDGKIEQLMRRSTQSS